MVEFYGELRLFLQASWHLSVSPHSLEGMLTIGPGDCLILACAIWFLVSHLMVVNPKENKFLSRFGGYVYLSHIQRSTHIIS